MKVEYSCSFEQFCNRLVLEKSILFKKKKKKNGNAVFTHKKRIILPIQKRRFGFK